MCRNRSQQPKIPVMNLKCPQTQHLLKEQLLHPLFNILSFQEENFWKHKLLEMSLSISCFAKVKKTFCFPEETLESVPNQQRSFSQVQRKSAAPVKSCSWEDNALVSVSAHKAESLSLVSSVNSGFVTGDHHLAHLSSPQTVWQGNIFFTSPVRRRRKRGGGGKGGGEEELPNEAGS